MTTQVDSIRGILESNEWNYEYAEDAAAFFLGFRTGDVNVHTIIRIHPHSTEVYAVLPQRVPGNARSGIGSAVLMLNSVLRTGRFHFDPVDGHVQFRLESVYHDAESPVTESTLQLMIEICVNALADSNDTFMKIMFADDEPVHAVKDQLNRLACA